MGRPPSRYEPRRHYAYANCTTREYAIVKARAVRDGLSVSDYVRQCINSVLLEEGEAVELLETRRPARGSADDAPDPEGR